MFVYKVTIKICATLFVLKAYQIGVLRAYLLVVGVGETDPRSNSGYTDLGSEPRTTSIDSPIPRNPEVDGTVLVSDEPDSYTLYESMPLVPGTEEPDLVVLRADEKGSVLMSTTERRQLKNK